MMFVLQLLVAFILSFLCWTVVIPFVSLIFKYTLGKHLFTKRHLLKTAGEWAIVTGSTDGIGKSYARELAKDGLNIMLISRNSEKLKNVAEEIESEFHVKTKSVTCDFTQVNIYDMLQREIDSLPSIACLVNNVGISYPNLDRFSDAAFLNQDFIQKLINCNMISMANLTRIVLPRLLKQGSMGSAIINMGSFSGLNPFPYLSLYGASKAFVRHLTESLFYEVPAEKVTFQVVCPLLVSTAMTKIKRTSFFVPDAQTFASNALDMLGVERVTSGYFGHALQAYALKCPMITAWMAKSKYVQSENRKRR